MSRPDRLIEEKHQYFQSFEKDFGDNLNKAKTAFSGMTSENAGQTLRKFYLREWIANQEIPMEQKAFQDEQIKVAKNANNIAIAAFVVSAVALLISLLK